MMDSAPEVGITAVMCLAFEARIASAPGVTVICNGRRERLHDLVERACARSAGLISFGVAGGLAPEVHAGDWVIAASVATDNGRYRTDERWTRQLCAALPGARCADVSGLDAPVSSTVAKLALARKHATVAVDTESHVVAEAATRRGLPFAVARVVLDPMWRALPPAALVPLLPDGNPDVAAVTRSVLRAPSQLAELGRITADAFRAWSSLRRGRLSLGPLFCFRHVASESEPFVPETIDGSGPELSTDYVVQV